MGDVTAAWAAHAVSAAPLIDSHVHLDRYPDAQVEAFLASATQVGVVAALTVGVDFASSRRACALARRYAAAYGLCCAAGLHPAFLPATPADCASALRDLEDWLVAQQGDVVALGEIGMDTIEAQAPLALQRDVFTAQWRLSAHLRLPVVLHMQGDAAHTSAQRILRPCPPIAGAVVHYFTGDLPLARRWLDLGCALSVGLPVTRVEQVALRKAIASPLVPLDLLVLETDTYPLPGRRTQPADVARVVAAVAELKQVSVAEVARVTSAHFSRLFLHGAVVGG